jgi:epoxide hydrolase 4
VRLDWAGVETIRVRANAIEFEVASLGAGDRLALCLHGFPEHAYSWRFQIPVLAALGYRVWAPNLRGYGSTDSPAEVSAYKLEMLLEDVAGLIRAANARETVLIGHDWGGFLAWMLSMRKPQLVNRLIVCNLPHPACFLRELKRPAQFLKSWYILFFQLPALPEILLGARNASGVGKMISGTVRDDSNFTKDVIDLYRENASRPGGLRAMINWYRAFVRGGGLLALHRSAWPRIDIPTLLIWGTADAALSIRTTHGTEQYVSDLTVRILPGVSHFVQQEAAEAVNSILKEWLRRDPLS